MARIVLASWGSYGDVNPYVGLALALRARGHEPVLATAGFYRALAEREGLAVHAVRPDVDPTDTAAVRRIMDARRGSEVVLRELLFPSIEDSFHDLAEATRGADLLVSHPVTFAAPLVAESTGIPWVSAVLAPMSFFSRYDAPVLPPAPALKRLDRFGAWPGKLLVALARRTTRSWSEPVRRLRARLGLAPGADPIYEGQHSPRLVLALFSRLLAMPQLDWPPNVRMTGQVSYDAAHGASLAPELERFLEHGPPPVVFTLGSSAVLAAGDFFEESVAAARRLGRRAVLLAGSSGVRRLAGTLTGTRTGDVIAVDAAPHSLLFPRAAAVVQQCGIGTLGTALRSGRPILAVPFAHDQPDNAHRARRLGVARTVYPRSYRAARVVRELGRLLDDPAYARAAERVGAMVRAEGGATAACDAIERIVVAGAAERPR